MRNKTLRLLATYILFILMHTFSVVGSEIKFEAENIEINDETFIKASNYIKVKDDKGMEISGDRLLIDKRKKNYVISGNVILEDILSQIKINAEKIIYFENENIIVSEGPTKINKNNEYFVETIEMKFDRVNGKISSKNKTRIKDIQGNNFDTENLLIKLNENLLSAENAVLTDKDLNIYKITNLYYDFEKKKLLGKDIVVNEDNKLSSKKLLSRIKSNSLIFENDISVFKKTVYTNCKKRDGCPPWLIKAKRIEHDLKKKNNQI